MSKRVGGFLKNLWGEKRERDRVISQLEKLGVWSVTDERLRERLVAFKELMDIASREMDGSSGLDAIRDLEERTRNVEKLMRIACLPWGRSGDTSERKYQILQQSWEELMSYAWKAIQIQKQNFYEAKERGDELKMNAVIADLADFLRVEIFAYTFMIANASWRDVDVGQSLVVSVQQPPIYGGGGIASITPTAGAMTSVEDQRRFRRSRRGSPQTLPNVIYDEEGNVVE